MTVGVRPDVSTKLNPLNVTELPVLSGRFAVYICVIAGASNENTL